MHNTLIIHPQSIDSTAYTYFFSMFRLFLCTLSRTYMYKSTWIKASAWEWIFLLAIEGQRCHPLKTKDWLISYHGIDVHLKKRAGTTNIWTLHTGARILKSSPYQSTVTIHCYHENRIIQLLQLQYVDAFYLFLCLGYFHEHSWGHISIHVHVPVWNETSAWEWKPFKFLLAIEGQSDRDVIHSKGF